MLFILRYRFLRSFTLETRGNPITIKKFNRWITIEEVPSEDELRYCLSTISTKTLNDLLKKFHSQIERRKLLINEPRLLNLELVALDGTGQISSTKIACEKCLTRAPAIEKAGNLVGVGPQLNPLSAPSTYVAVLVPQITSPAIDAGSNTFCTATDQTGLARPVNKLGGGAICDIGAVEVP